MATTTPVSPKVKAAALWGAVSGILLTALGAITTGLDPHIFDFLGAWSGVVYSAVVTGAATLAGYLTRDPLRDAGAQAVAPSYTEPSVVEESAAPGTFGDPSVTNKE